MKVEIEMGTVSAKRIEAALERAKSVGEVEEPFTVMGCAVTLQSLKPADYEAINQETSELEDLAYLNAFRVGHLSRSIVELNGLNLRKVDYIEVEVEDPRTKDVKPVKVERHAYIRDFVLSTWGKEALDVGFRKFTDLIAKSEKAAEEGVEFINVDEQPDEKLRRLVTEVKSLMGEVPRELVERILTEHGLVLAVTKEEAAALDAKLTKMEAPKLREELYEEHPVVRQVVEQPPPTDRPLTASQAAQTVPEDLMRNRVPVVTSTARQPLPSTIPPVVQPGPAQPLSVPPRSQQYADLEAEADAELGGVLPTVTKPPSSNAPTEVYSMQEGVGQIGRQLQVDPKVARLVDAPPVGGINPRFKKPNSF
jgi:hypothetical protein